MASGASKRSGTKKGKNQHPSPRTVQRVAGRNISVPLDLDVKIVRVREGSLTTITPFVESLSWSDENSSDGSSPVSGSITMRRHESLKPGSQPIEDGDRVQVLWRAASAPASAPWNPEITLRAVAPESEPKTGVVNLTLADPYTALEAAQAVFVYRKDHGREHGWRMHQIIRDACKRMGVPTGYIAEGHATFPSPWKSDPGFTGPRKIYPASPLLQFINKTTNKEFQLTGRRVYPFFTDDGKLEIRDFGASTRAYRLDVSVQEFQVQTNSNSHPVTVIHATGRTGKGKDAKHLKATVPAPRAVQKFGRVVREQDFGVVYSHRHLRELAKRMLAHGSHGGKADFMGLRPVRTATVTVPGFPGARPMDAVLLERGSDTPDRQGYFAPEEFGGEQGIAYITQRGHSIEAGLWTTQLTLRETDPWAHYQARLAAHDVGYKRKNQSPSHKKHEKHHAHSRS